jgi:nucleoid DNA-binding protein/cell division septation protein DedD
MDRKEFLEKVASKIGADVKEVEQVFQKFIDSVTTALRDGEKVNLASFGTFSPKITRATKKFSALLNREIEIPEKFTISFSPASKVAEEINLKYRDEKPTVIQEASEREIEKKVSIMTPDQEEISKTEKSMEESLQKEEKISEEKFEEESEKDVSLSAELLEALKEVEERLQEEEKSEEPHFVPEAKETKEEKEEVSQMPEMNLNQDKPKYTFGEDLTSQPIGSGSYQAPYSTSGAGPSPSSSTKEGSGVLWVTLIILLIGIIGVGIYWALSSDVTETKKEPVVELKKETTPPVVIQKQPPTSGKKQIIIAPEEYSSIPSDTSIKQKTSMIVEETTPPKKEVEKQKPEVSEKTTIVKSETKPTVTTVTESVKPIQRKKITTAKVVKKPIVSSQGDYFIQVNSYTEKRFADAFAKDLRNKGYRAFVEASEVPGVGKMYRVKVGFYLDEDAAAKDYHNLRLLLKKEDIFVDRR